MTPEVEELKLPRLPSLLIKAKSPGKILQLEETNL